MGIAKRYTHAGQTLTLQEWAARTGIDSGTLASRIRAKWQLERVFTRPVASAHNNALDGFRPGQSPEQRRERKRKTNRAWQARNRDKIKTYKWRLKLRQNGIAVPDGRFSDKRQHTSTVNGGT